MRTLSGRNCSAAGTTRGPRDGWRRDRWCRRVRPAELEAQHAPRLGRGGKTGLRVASERMGATQRPSWPVGRAGGSLVQNPGAPSACWGGPLVVVRPSLLQLGPRCEEALDRRDSPKHVGPVAAGRLDLAAVHWWVGRVLGGVRRARSPRGTARCGMDCGSARGLLCGSGGRRRAVRSVRLAGTHSPLRQRRGMRAPNRGASQSFETVRESADRNKEALMSVFEQSGIVGVPLRSFYHVVAQVAWVVRARCGGARIPRARELGGSWSQESWELHRAARDPYRVWVSAARSPAAGEVSRRSSGALIRLAMTPSIMGVRHFWGVAAFGGSCCTTGVRAAPRSRRGHRP